jgi:ribosomal-protein-alanine N-acetyltransferase
MENQRLLVLAGERISLGILSEADVPFLLKTINDPEVNRYLSNPGRIIYEHEEIEWVRNLGQKEHDNRHFAIMENSSGNIAGVIGVRGINLSNGSGVLGYFLAREYWGKGYSTEAVSLSVRFCFETLNLRKLNSAVFEPNTASMRVLVKNGFKECGRYHKHSFVRGHGFVDEVLFEKFNENHAS